MNGDTYGGKSLFSERTANTRRRSVSNFTSSFTFFGGGQPRDKLLPPLQFVYVFVFGVSRNLKWTGIGCTTILSTKLLFPDFSFLRQPLHHFLQACVSRHRLFSFPRTKFVLDSAIAVLVFGIPSTPDWPILLFCSVFLERGCVTFQIRHTPFYARNPS